MSSNEQFDALLIGGGFAMFGTPEGPWNITKRLEQKLGPRLNVVAVIEVDPARAEAALEKKRAGSWAATYEGTVILRTVEEFEAKVKQGELKKPNAIFVATPPNFRGGLQPPRNLELTLNSLFPTTPIFLEKPVATGPSMAESVSEAREVARTLNEKHGGAVSIGYVLRYLKATQEIKRILKENDLQVMAVVARCVTAYELAVKTDWWTTSILQGPIIEQMTHFVDLIRFIGGEVDMTTISGHALEAKDKPGQLTKLRFDESKIPLHDRIPRATTASWKYKSGGVGTLLHAIALHGVEYTSQLEVYADGYQLILSNPFGTSGAPQLHVRQPGSDALVLIPTPVDDDAYFTEIDAFIDVVDGKGSKERILCGYEDAVGTYEMTWAVRAAAEKWMK